MVEPVKAVLVLPKIAWRRVFGGPGVERKPEHKCRKSATAKKNLREPEQLYFAMFLTHASVDGDPKVSGNLLVGQT